MKFFKPSDNHGFLLLYFLFIIILGKRLLYISTRCLWNVSKACCVSLVLLISSQLMLLMAWQNIYLFWKPYNLWWKLIRKCYPQSVKHFVSPSVFKYISIGVQALTHETLTIPRDPLWFPGADHPRCNLDYMSAGDTVWVDAWPGTGWQIHSYLHRKYDELERALGNNTILSRGHRLLTWCNFNPSMDK